MKLYLKIFLSHKILFFLLFCGFSIFIFSLEMFLYKFAEELADHTILIDMFFYFLIVIVLCFNLYLILDKMTSVCKSQFDVLMLCGFPLRDIIKKFMMMVSLCGMAGGLISDIFFFYVVSENIGFCILLLGIAYIVFLFLCFMEYKIMHRTLSGRFNNV